MLSIKLSDKIKKLSDMSLSDMDHCLYCQTLERTKKWFYIIGLLIGDKVSNKADLTCG